MNLPQVRTTDIIEQEADGELLIYDQRINKAYNLNETSKIIYRACGYRTFDELKKERHFSDDLIHFALSELQKNDLLETDYVSPFTGLSRRELVRKVGLTSLIAFPVVAVLVAPTAISAASVNCTCTAPASLNARIQGLCMRQ